MSRNSKAAAQNVPMAVSTDKSRRHGGRSQEQPTKRELRRLERRVVIVERAWDFVGHPSHSLKAVDRVDFNYTRGESPRLFLPPAIS